MYNLLARREIMLSMPEEYITFRDPVIEGLCVNAWGDGERMSKRAAQKVSTTQFLSVFGNGKNTDEKEQATSFDEFLYFTKVTDAGHWLNCKSLESITLPRSCTTIGINAFSGCSSLARINLDRIRYMRHLAFRGCSSLAIAINMPYLAGYYPGYTALEYETFRDSGITKILNLGRATTLGYYGFAQNSPNLSEVWLPATITDMARLSFYGCGNLSILVCLAETPPTIATTTLNSTGAALKIYVPYSEDHSILAAYQSATNWSTYSARMLELSPDGNIPE